MNGWRNPELTPAQRERVAAAAGGRVELVEAADVALTYYLDRESESPAVLRKELEAVSKAAGALLARLEGIGPQARSTLSAELVARRYRREGGYRASEQWRLLHETMTTLHESALAAMPETQRGKPKALRERALVRHLAQAWRDVTGHDPGPTRGDPFHEYARTVLEIAGYVDSPKAWNDQASIEALLRESLM